jgi:aminoglycoside 6'-N-acetyltransferase
MAAVTHVVTLREMAGCDLPMVGRWLLEPHVARWWADDPGEQLAEFELAVEGRDPTQLLIVEDGGQAVGWCQWYRWADYPDAAPEYGATDGDFGFDYGIGEFAAIGHGLGTELIGQLVRRVWAAHPRAPILVAVSTLNAGSRRVLEKNGFDLVDVRMIESEPGDEPTALYRLVGDLGRA